MAGSSSTGINFQQTQHAAFFANGTAQFIPQLGPADSGSGIVGLNDKNNAVGFSGLTFSQEHAFLYADGTTTDLGSLGGQHTSSAALGINDLGQIVGFSEFADGNNMYHAFLDQDGTMTDLNSLVDLSGTNFVYLDSASSINNLGQIVGLGVLANGDYEAYLLTSGVPEPVSAGILACAGCLLGRTRGRSRARGFDAHMGVARPYQVNP